MGRFKNSRLARMSSGHYCLIRDLGLVKGGKGLRHHEVILDFSWHGLLRLLISAARTSCDFSRLRHVPLRGQSRLAATGRSDDNQ
jgi:hypothetical protein